MVRGGAFSEWDLMCLRKYYNDYRLLFIVLTAVGTSPTHLKMIACSMSKKRRMLYFSDEMFFAENKMAN